MGTNDKGTFKMKKVVKRQKHQWSYSHWELFTKCKYAFYLRTQQKIKAPETYPMMKGKEVHLKGEYFLRGAIKGMPKEFESVKKQMNLLLEYEAEPEIDLAITRKFKPTVYDDWNNVWLRGRADALLDDPKKETRLLLVDFKTGKKYPSHISQGAIYSMAGFCHYDVQEIRVEFWYLNTGEILDAGTYTYKKDFPRLKNDWVKKWQKMFNTKVFPKNTESCGFCGYHQNNGGPCNGKNGD
jgi:hypothetical protein